MMKDENINSVYVSSVNGRLTVDELLKRELEFPYCSMIQFQLLQAYQHIDTESFSEISQKAAVYFPDLLKLNCQLNLNNPVIRTNKFIEDKVAKEERITNESFTTGKELQNKNGESNLNTNVEEVTNLNITEGSKHILNDDPKIYLHEPVIEELKNDEQDIKQFPAFEGDIKKDNINDSPDEPDESVAAKLDLLPIDDVVKPTSSDAAFHTAAVKEYSNEVTKSNSVPQSSELIFEPLYTKDYFASLGIKLSDEIASNDKLGNQMKSFTQWLKSMKKIHQEISTEPDEIVDKKIQSIAETSNTTEEVVTESMANVLLLQGKHEKAVEMFEKLSLLNPSKSAYFAAIIQVLKKG